MPAPDPELFRLNAVPFSWASLLLFVDGLARRRFTAISYEEKLERKAVQIAARDGRPIDLTAGEYSVTGMSITMLPDEERWLRSYLHEKGGGHGAGEPYFSLQLQLSERDVTQQIDFPKCKLGGSKNGHQAGSPEALVVECAIDCTFLVKDGVPLFDPQRAAL